MGKRSASTKPTGAKSGVSASTSKPKAKTKSTKKRATSSKGAAKKSAKDTGSKKSTTTKKPTQSAVSSLDTPSTVGGMSILEIIASSPKVAGVMPRPRFVPIQNHHIVGVEVEDARVDLVKPFMDYPQGQHVVAIFIPLENSTEAVQWLVLNKDMDLMQAPKGSDWKEREVSTAFIADLLGFTSKRRVQQLSAEGHLKKNSRGRYNLNESIKLYMQHLKDQATGKGGTQLVDRKLKGLDLDNQNKEVDLKKKTEELVDAHGARKAGIELGLKVNDSLARWDGLYGTRLAKAKNKQSVVSILTEARLRLQGELAKEGNGNGSGS